MEQEYYSSKHFTAEQIDQRLLKGTYDDAVVAGYNGTKDEFDRQVATMVSSSRDSTGNQEVDNAYIKVISEAIRKVPQTLTETEKVQARTNIGAISSDDIKDGNFLNAGSITSSKIATAAIGKSHIADEAVTNSKIKDGTISHDKIDPLFKMNLATGVYIEDGTLTPAQMSQLVVNDLTTGGADKALSAEMGAKINEKVGYDEYSYNLGASTEGQDAVTINFENKEDYHIHFKSIIGDKWRIAVNKKDGNTSYINPSTFARYGLTPSIIDPGNVGVSSIRLYMQASDSDGYISFSVSYNLKLNIDMVKEEIESKIGKILLDEEVGDVLAVGLDYNVVAVPNMVALDKTSIAGKSVNLFNPNAKHRIYSGVDFKQSTGKFIQDSTLVQKGFVLILGKNTTGTNRVHFFTDFDMSVVEQLFAFTITELPVNWNGVSPVEKGSGDTINKRCYIQSTSDDGYLAVFASFKNNKDYNTDIIEGIVQTLNGSWETEYIPYDESKIKYVSAIQELPQLVEGKLDKNQGAQNAGKTLQVGADGNVVPVQIQPLDTQDVTDCVRKKDIDTLYLGRNLLDGIIGSGDGWEYTDGAYTHTEGTEPLVFSLNTENKAAYVVTIYSSTNDFYEEEIMVSLGNGEPCDIYKGVIGPNYVGMLSDGGQLKVWISSTRGLSVHGIELRKIVEQSSAELTISYQNYNVNIDSGDNITGFWNVVIASNNCMQKNQNGSRNIAIGNNSLTKMTAGERNIAVGTFALNQLIRGTRNIAIGADAMYRTACAHKNVAIGKAAAGFTHADPSSHKYESNTAIGYNALGARAKDYKDNTAVGANAMGGNIDDAISRERNVAVGYEACHYGEKDNVAVGYRADRYTKGSNNVAIGNNTGDSSETGSNNVLIGSNAKIKSGEGTWQSPVEHSNTIVIGANAIAKKSNQVVIGNAQQTEVILLGNKRIIFNSDGTVSWESI